MKKIIVLVVCVSFLCSCSNSEPEPVITSTIDSAKAGNDFLTIESIEKSTGMLKGFWYNPVFFEKVKASQKVKENLKNNYQYFYLNDEGLVQREEGFTAQDYIPVNFAIKNNKLYIYDHASFAGNVSFKNDSTILLRTIGLNKDTLNLTLRKLNGSFSKKTELDQYEYLLAINTVAGKYVNEKGQEIEFMADGTFIGFDLTTEYFVEGLGYEGLDGDYEFDAISIKNEETLISYKWTLADNVLTLTEIEPDENSHDFKLSSKSLIFKKK